MTQTTGKGDLRNYILVTGAYWADTVADGASRMLVLFYFYQLGYTPFEVASLFLFYEFFGIVTNLVGGWVAARLGLKATLFSGLGIQIFALAMLGLAPETWLVVPFVMASQALSGIAKDLTKMSSKSAVKLVVPEDSESSLFKWVAVLTGSKNALKGVGFFIGGLLLTLVGFQTGMLLLVALVAVALITAATMMHGGLGTTDGAAKFRHMFSNDRAINVLAAARVFLFASRDVWFVVGLPVYLRTVLGWSFWEVGTFLAIWVIGYGIVQASAPTLMKRHIRKTGRQPDGHTATWLAVILAAFPAGIAIALTANFDPTTVLVLGLITFGVIFALNSAVHSYLVLSYAASDKVAMNVGFYYMANAGGRLVGTVLSGAMYQWYGLVGCLWTSFAFVIAAAALSFFLPGAGRTRARSPKKPETPPLPDPLVRSVCFSHDWRRPGQERAQAR
ncbi:MAG: organoarsenical effux MFS transporter ArsJ [Solirubrobacterales bacterium]